MPSQKWKKGNFKKLSLKTNCNTQVELNTLKKTFGDIKKPLEFKILKLKQKLKQIKQIELEKIKTISETKDRFE